MSPEPVAALAVGVALAGPIPQGRQSLGRRMDRLDGPDARLRAVEAGLAEVKGRLAVVRDCISGRNARPGEPAAAPAE